MVDMILRGVGRTALRRHENYDICRMLLRHDGDIMAVYMAVYREVSTWLGASRIARLRSIMRDPRWLYEIQQRLKLLTLILLGRRELQPRYAYVQRARRPVYRSVPTRRA